MQTLTYTYDNSSERLQENKADFDNGFDTAKVIREHAFEYRQEIDAVTQLLKAMGDDKKSAVVEQWATRSDEWESRSRQWAVETNMIGKVTGVDTSLTLEETSKAYKEDYVFDGEFGDLREFDPEKNIRYLENLNNDGSIQPQALDVTSSMLEEARILVESLALDNPVSDGRFEVFKASNEQFILDA